MFVKVKEFEKVHYKKYINPISDRLSKNQQTGKSGMPLDAHPKMSADDGEEQISTPLLHYIMIPLLRAKLVIFLVLSICLATGCQNAKEQVQLDFSNIEPVKPKVSGSTPILNVAVSAMTSPQETFHSYKNLLNYIEINTGRHILFKQRETYLEVNELLFEDKLDLAFICSGAYVTGVDTGWIRLLVVPVINGQTTYQSYLLVPSNSPATSIADLYGKQFAYTDPLSLSGCLYPKYLIHQLGYSTQEFFSQTIFTNGHDKAINAVVRRMVDGACVDGLVYDYLAVKRPNKLSGIKVIHKSQPFGIPPVVIPNGLDSDLEHLLRETLLSMHLDPQGKGILAELMIDRFTVSHDSLYNSVRRIRAELSSVMYE